jgi:hypothetical protein
MPISRQKLINELLPALEQLFQVEHNKYQRTEYHMKSSYGKYSIYRWDYEGITRKSTTLAKGLSREEATGMMKLLKEQ